MRTTIDTHKNDHRHGRRKIWVFTSGVGILVVHRRRRSITAASRLKAEPTTTTPPTPPDKEFSLGDMGTCVTKKNRGGVFVLLI